MAVCLLSGSKPGPLRAQERWAVSEEPKTVVGSLVGGPGHDLDRVEDATVLRDGSIAVVSAGTHDIRIFSQTGGYLRTFGRLGDGPGEFRGRVWWVEECGLDSLVAFDPAPNRLTYFSPTGTLHGTETIQLPANLLGTRIQPPFSDGSLLGVRMATYQDRLGAAISERKRLVDPDGMRRETVHFLRVEEENLDTLLALETRDMISVTQKGEGPSATLRAMAPFSAEILWATGKDFFVVGYGDAQAFRIYDSRGEQQQVLRGIGAPREATAADRRAFRIWYLEEGGPENWRELRQMILEQATWSDSIPLFDSAVVDNEGLIWLREFRFDGEKRDWQIYSQVGVHVARATIPFRIQVYEIGIDYVLGEITGDYDEEMVVLLELSR